MRHWYVVPCEYHVIKLAAVEGVEPGHWPWGREWRSCGERQEVHRCYVQGCRYRQRRGSCSGFRCTAFLPDSLDDNASSFLSSSSTCPRGIGADG